MLRKTSILCLVLGCAIAFAANSQSATLKVSELKIQIDKVRQEIKEEEKAWAEEQSRETDAEKKRKERYEQFIKEKQASQAELVKLDQQIQERMDQVERLKVRGDNLQGQVKFLRSLILEEVRAYETLVQQGFPYRIEKRVESVQILVDDLVKERISPEEGLNRLWVLYMTEHGAASEGEIFTGNADVGDGKQTAVKFMRVGKQVLAYTTPAGDKMGVLIKTPEGKWDYWREDKMDFDTRTAVRHAIAVAEGKAVPGFVAFPFQIKTFKTETK